MLIKYGMIPNLPVDMHLNKTDKNLDIRILRNHRDKCFDKYAKKYVQKGYRSDNREFFIGDKILVYITQGKTKIQSKWDSGYVIIKEIHKNAYLVKKDGQILRVNKE
ncbi:hypothetical protein COBT_003725, partial [Conglomerata obtusa]